MLNSSNNCFKTVKSLTGNRNTHKGQKKQHKSLKKQLEKVSFDLPKKKAI